MHTGQTPGVEITYRVTAQTDDVQAMRSNLAALYDPEESEVFGFLRTRLPKTAAIHTLSPEANEDGYIGDCGDWVAALDSYWNHAVPPSPQIIHSEAAHLQYLQDRAVRNLQITHIERSKTAE